MIQDSHLINSSPSGATYHSLGERRSKVTEEELNQESDLNLEIKIWEQPLKAYQIVVNLKIRVL